ncbi:MAG: ABC transporter permease [Clostridia bacterium]|nr:ABC transporter permease [Clostridia bacterium]
MKSNTIFTIFKKELSRFFKDRRTLVALLMPGILIYVIYSLMGGAMSEAFVPDEEYKPHIVAVNLPESVHSMIDSETVILTTVAEDRIDDIKESVAAGGSDILVVFPSDFDAAVLAYSPASGERAPCIEIYFNSSDTNSTTAYTYMTTLLDVYESAMANKFDVNMGGGAYDLATDEDMTSMIFSMLMPMLLVMLLFSGCMAVAPESIAGEKERGTIAALLVTPAKRGHIAVGKILALSVMALISGTSSTLGVVLSLPKLMGDTVSIDGSVYSITDYAMLAVVILSTVLVLITVISIISAYAKTVKEASSYVTPLMILSMLIGLSGMMGMTAANPALYLIPIYNSVQCMIGIFSFEASILNMAVTVVANLAITAIGVFVLTRMFNSERIMFNK